MPPTMPITADRPYWAVVANKPACVVGAVKGVSLSWTSGGVPAGQVFRAWVVQRSDDTFGYFEIARITLLADTTFVDWEGRRNVVCSYRVAMETDSGISPFSTVRTTTPPGCCGYTFTSNAQPDLNLARDDIGDREPEWPDDDVTFVPLYGRNNVVAFRGLEDPGDELRVKLLLWTAASPPSAGLGIGPGTVAWEPVRRIVRAQTPYVCVLDENGSRWYAVVTSDGGGSHTNGALSWIASLRVRQVADRPYSVSA